jgi:seryl-tRNA synthetase
MLEITRIRTDKVSIIEGLKKRNLDVAPTIDRILDKDQQWRAAKTDLEAIAAEQNQLAKQIGELFKQGKQAEANTAKSRTGELKVKETELKGLVDSLDQEITQLLYTLPNVPNELVNAGKDEKDNEVVFEAGTQPSFVSEPFAHWDLARK